MARVWVISRWRSSSIGGNQMALWRDPLNVLQQAGIARIGSPSIGAWPQKQWKTPTDGKAGMGSTKS